VPKGADIRNLQEQILLMQLAHMSNCEPIIRFLVERGLYPKPLPRISRGPLQRRLQPGSIEVLKRKIRSELIEADFAKMYGSDTRIRTGNELPGKVAKFCLSILVYSSAHSNI
jgi:hypothetical protein